MLKPITFSFIDDYKTPEKLVFADGNEITDPSLIDFILSLKDYSRREEDTTEIDIYSTTELDVDYFTTEMDIDYFEKNGKVRPKDRKLWKDSMLNSVKPLETKTLPQALVFPNEKASMDASVLSQNQRAFENLRNSVGNPSQLEMHADERHLVTATCTKWAPIHLGKGHTRTKDGYWNGKNEVTKNINGCAAWGKSDGKMKKGENVICVPHPTEVVAGTDKKKCKVADSCQEIEEENDCYENGEDLLSMEHKVCRTQTGYCERKSEHIEDPRAKSEQQTKCKDVIKLANSKHVCGNFQEWKEISSAGACRLHQKKATCGDRWSRYEVGCVNKKEFCEKGYGELKKTCMRIVGEGLQKIKQEYVCGTEDQWKDILRIGKLGRLKNLEPKDTAQIEKLEAELKQKNYIIK